MLRSIKGKKIYPMLRDMITPVYSFVLIHLFRLFPVKKNKIMMVSYYGKGYNGNCKYIAEELLKKDQNVSIYWAVKNQYKDSIPGEIHSVKYFSIKYFFHLVTSKVWINNARFLNGIRKRKKQFYIQVWHGDVAFKKIEADAEASLQKGYIKAAKNDSKMINLMTSGSGFFSDLCRNAFWYKGEILECGSARNDIFFNEKKCKGIYDDVRKKLDLKEDDKILLYAPTFRKSETLEYYDIGFKDVLSALSEKFKGNWKIVVRLHPNIAVKSHELDIWSNDVIDGTPYPDSQELLIASDALITDYSSIAFDYSLQRRPVFLFAPDYEEYNSDRSFYLDYFNLPFVVAENKKQLHENVLNFSKIEYNKKLEIFFKDTIKSKESGRASEVIVQRIIKEIDETKRR